MKLPIRVLLTAALASATLVACTGTKTTKPNQSSNDSGGGSTTTQVTDQGGSYKPDDLDKDSCLRQRVVYFDFDQSTIRNEFQAVVACHAKFLHQFPGARVTLEGNADERGTREYNMGLGERRGNAVSSAMGSSGASSSQLNVVSYGEERPVCKDHSEGCWQKNRRVEIIYTSKP
jgi:peptidoglycan-associated lipoprotein